jgi:predicted GH43/DUF377 family glycosyl hydrolase
VSARHYETLLHRHSGNPILSAADWPYPAHTVFNPGATRLPDGTTLLLCRVEDRRGHSHLCAARSRNGIDGWVIDARPTLSPDPDRYPEELWGIEDPRITFVEELGKYAITYTAFSRGGPGVALALTTDFRSFERLGLIMQPDDKDAALLPRRIDGNFALIHRPIAESGAHIWVSFSPDLRNWGGHKLLLPARRGGWWDANKVGLSPPLIETPRGWLMIYHGVRHTRQRLYRLGVALLDRTTLITASCEATPGCSAPKPLRTQRRCPQRRLSLRIHRWRGRRYPAPLLWCGGHDRRTRHRQHSPDSRLARRARARVTPSGEQRPGSGGHRAKGYDATSRSTPS